MAEGSCCTIESPHTCAGPSLVRALKRMITAAITAPTTSVPMATGKTRTRYWTLIAKCSVITFRDTWNVTKYVPLLEATSASTL
jgi:hypothetical protein